MKSQRKLAESVLRGFSKTHFLNARPEASPQVLLDDIMSLGQQRGPSKNGCYHFQNGRSKYVIDFAQMRYVGNAFWQAFLTDICDSAIDTNLAIMNAIEGLDNEFVLLLEIIFYCLYHLVRSRNITDVAVAVASAVSHTCNVPATVIFGQVFFLLSSMSFYKLSELHDWFVGHRVSVAADEQVFVDRPLDEQSLIDTVDSSLRAIENTRDLVDKVWTSDVAKNLRGIIEVVIALTISHQEGITVTKQMITNVGTMQRSQLWWNTPSPYEFIVRSTINIARCVVSSVKLRSFDPLFGDGDAASSWSRKSQLLLELKDHLATLEAHGTNIHEYTKELADAIQRGSMLLRATPNSLEKRIMETKLSQLRLCQNDMLSTEFAAKVRDPPFAVLLHGGTSVGKTTLSDIMYQYYARVEPSGTLKATPEFKYCRNSTEEHWNNFTTTHWAIFFDEVAPFRPGTLTEPDKTTAELLGVCNSAPYTPPQAALMDKGKTPVKSKLVVATTNVVDLNVRQYFENPSAVMRRFHMIVDVRVKDMFAKGNENARLLDYSKTDPTTFPDFWEFDVYKVNVIPKTGVAAPRCTQDMQLVKIHSFTNISDFLHYYRLMILQHDRECKTMKTSTDLIASMELCQKMVGDDICALPRSLCGHEYSPTEEDEVVDAVVEAATDMAFQAGSEGESAYDKFQNFSDALLTWPQRIRLRIVKYLVNKSWFVQYAIRNLSAEVLERFINTLDWQSVHLLLANVGKATCSHMAKSPLVRTILVSAGSILAIIGMIFGVMKLTQKKQVAPDDVPKIGRAPGTSVMEHQAYSGDQEPVWYKDDYQTTSFELGRTTMSWSGASQEFIVRQLSRSIARCVYRDGKDAVHNNALALGDCLWVTNAHFLKPMYNTEVFTMSIFLGGSTGVSENVRDMPIFKSMIDFDWEHDLAFLWLPSLPPRKNILELLPKKTLRGVHEGFVLRRERISRGPDGQYLPSNIEVPPKFWGVRYRMARVKSTGYDIDAFIGNINVPTETGQCGGVAISTDSTGPIILGIHSLGHQNEVAFVPVWREFATEAMLRRTKFVANAGALPLNEDCPDVLPSLHKKDPLRFIPEGSVEAYGTVVGFRSHPKSFVVSTPLYGALSARGWVCNYGAPAMTGWLPKHNALKDILDAKCWLDVAVLNKCADQFVVDIVDRLPDDWRVELGVSSLEEALNGVPGVAHLDRINVSTSCGFPYRGPKKKFLADSNGCHEGTLMLDPKIENAVHEAIEIYRSGSRYNPIFTAALKDEPRKFEKIQKNMTRMFQVSPLVFTIVFRQYFLRLLRVFYTSHEAFEAAPGVAANTGEWDQLAQYLEVHGDRLIDGDFAKFDTALKAPILRAVLSVLLELADQSGRYTKEDLQVMYLLGLDAMYVNLEFFGSIFQLYGMNSSGNPATVVFNCLGHSILMRFVYYMNHPMEDLTSFTEYIGLTTYGDDGVMRVHPECWWMSYSIIRDTLASVGITYTSADKKFEGPDFKPLNQISYLKRAFRFEPELGHYVAALDIASIEKMVMKCVRSRTVPMSEQTIEAVHSAVRELFFHGREVFNKKVKELQDAVKESGMLLHVKPHTFVTWDFLADDYASKSVKRDFFKGSKEPGRFLRPVVGHVSEVQHMNQSADDHPSNCVDPWVRETSVEVGQDSPGRSPKALFRADFGRSSNHPNPESSIGLDSTGLNNRSAQTNREIMDLEFQSGTIENPLPNEEVQREETVQFSSAVSGERDGFKGVPVSSSAMEKVTLSKFLSRPVQISYSLWTTSDPVGPYKTIVPWYEFLNNSYIKSKIANYSYIRGNLKVKILVNATPFVYGAAIASYYPLSGYNKEPVVAGLTTDYIIPRSQRPHVWIYPSNSAGGELTLPFFYMRDWLELNSELAVRSMGALYLDIVTPLQSATSSVNIDCSIQIYAWMEDVELNGPTVALALQSGRDEYVGPISGPASAVAAAAGKLAKEPKIGRLMTATQLGATAVAKISSLFGFSNKIDISGDISVRNTGFPQLATSGTAHPVHKLSLDPKNELGVSPELHGLEPMDPLTISNIVERESFVDYFGWTPTQTTDTLLFSGRVNPKIYSWGAGGVAGTGIVNMTPMCWVAKLFRYWRGSIVYRFKFVCTPYHKGRVYITYDPTGSIASNIANTADTSAVAQTYVVDLATNTDFEICVPYCQATPWCALQSRMSGANQWANFTTPSYGYQEGFDNGTITVRVQTELSSPNGAATVAVLVFARGGDDLEFGGPGVDNGEVISYFAPQSGVVHELSETTAPDARYLLNMGERITTLRSLIQRRQKLTTLVFSQTTGTNCQRNGIKIGRTPPSFGYDPNGLYTVKKQDNSTNTVGNLFDMNMLAWLWPAFVGVKGSLEYMLNSDTSATVGCIRMYRSGSENTPGVFAYSDIVSSDTQSVAWYLNTVDAGTGGLAITNQRIQPGLTVSFPYYNINTFQPTDIGLGTVNSIPTTQWSATVGTVRNATELNLARKYDFLIIEAVRPPGVSVSGAYPLYVAAGTDFTFLWFLSTPTAYIYAHGISA